MRFYFSAISSTDEVATDHILKGIQVFASVCGQLERTTNRDSFISCICKSALPVNYYANNLALLIQQHQSATSSTSNTNIPLSKTLSTDSTSKEMKEDLSNGHSIVVRPIFIFLALYYNSEMLKKAFTFITNNCLKEKTHTFCFNLSEL